MLELHDIAPKEEIGKYEKIEPSPSMTHAHQGPAPVNLDRPERLVNKRKGFLHLSLLNV